MNVARNEKKIKIKFLQVDKLYSFHVSFVPNYNIMTEL